MSYQSTTHSFDIRVAKEYGIEEAIIIHHFQFWLNKNLANEQNINDGRAWTYNSINALAKLFPYMSAKKVRTAIDNLVSCGVLVKGNYNQSAYDRTAWYAFNDQEKWLFTDSEPEQSICLKRQIKHPKKANQIAEKGEPIPDNKQILNTDIKTDKSPPPLPEEDTPPKKEQIPQSTQPCYEWAISNLFWSSKITSLSKFLQLYANPSPNGLKAQYEASIKMEKDKEWQVLPFDNDDLAGFARKYGFTKPDGFDCYAQYRQALKRDIQNRLKSERKAAA